MGKGKYTVSFNRVDFGRRLEMALYDHERRAFVVPNFEYKGYGEHPRLFMAGKPQEFADFINALIHAWNEYQNETMRDASNLADLYADNFLQGAISDAQEQDR